MSRLIKTRKQGFTLIEMMVAVSIFVIVAFIVVSALLTMSYAYKKAQKMRLIMDNFNFALQSMSLNLREGVDYDFPSCGSNPAGSCVSFVPLDTYLGGDTKKVCYSQEVVSSNEKYIKKCDLAIGTNCPCGSSGSKLTSADILVDSLKFVVNDGDPIKSNAQNKIKIFIEGKAGAGTRAETSFAIQNTISQRSSNK